MPTLLKLHYEDGSLFYVNWDNVEAFAPTTEDPDALGSEIQFTNPKGSIPVKESTTEILAQILRG